jgi:predicted ArsR family transcriptional regulator
MRPTTRLRILEYLRKHHTATASELGRALGMTGANIRHHLAVLETNALVEVASLRREGRGRPVQVYALSRHVLGDGLDELSAAAFAEWLGDLPDEQQETALQKLAARLAGEAARSGPGSLLPRRLALTVARLNELHYQARWEAGPLGPRVILGHCPYAAILERVPALCRMDAHLLEQFLGLTVHQVSPGARGRQGEGFCTFQAHQ